MSIWSVLEGSVKISKTSHISPKKYIDELLKSHNVDEYTLHVGKYMILTSATYHYEVELRVCADGIEAANIFDLVSRNLKQIGTIENFHSEIQFT